MTALSQTDAKPGYGPGQHIADHMGDRMDTNNLRGAFFVIAAMQLFILNDAFVKSLTGLLEWHQALVLRGITATLFLLLVSRWIDGKRPLRGAVHCLADGRVLARAGFEMMVVTFWTIGLMHMTLSGIVAVNQLLPVFLMLGGAVVYREKIGPHRLGAAVVSFAGVLLVVRPGTESFSIYALYGVLATMMMAGRDIVTRGLKTTLPSSHVALVSTVLITIYALVASIGSAWLRSDSIAFCCSSVSLPALIRSASGCRRLSASW